MQCKPHNVKPSKTLAGGLQSKQSVPPEHPWCLIVRGGGPPTPPKRCTRIPGGGPDLCAHRKETWISEAEKPHGRGGLSQLGSQQGQRVRLPGELEQSSVIQLSTRTGFSTCFSRTQKTFEQGEHRVRRPKGSSCVQRVAGPELQPPTEGPSLSSRQLHFPPGTHLCGPPRSASCSPEQDREASDGVAVWLWRRM